MSSSSERFRAGSNSHWVDLGRPSKTSRNSYRRSSNLGRSPSGLINTLIEGDFQRRRTGSQNANVEMYPWRTRKLLDEGPFSLNILISYIYRPTCHLQVKPEYMVPMRAASTRPFLTSYLPRTIWESLSMSSSSAGTTAKVLEVGVYPRLSAL